MTPHRLRQIAGIWPFSHVGLTFPLGLDACVLVPPSQLGNKSVGMNKTPCFHCLPRRIYASDLLGGS